VPHRLPKCQILSPVWFTSAEGGERRDKVSACGPVPAFFQDFLARLANALNEYKKVRLIGSEKAIVNISARTHLNDDLIICIAAEVVAVPAECR
jgi:hypothetical protein